MPTTAAAGLTTADASRRLAADGRNEIPTPPPRRVWAMVGDQVRDPLVLILVAAAALTTLTRDLQDTVVIMAVVVVNTAIGVAQEFRANREMDALSHLSAPTARVIRDGAPAVVPAGEVVRGDVALLALGDVVPADGVVLDAHALQVDESLLTGESLPVNLAEGGAVRAGTVVTRGRARVLITATGSASAIGRISLLLGRPGRELTPLQRRLAQLGRTLGGLAVAVSGIVLVLGLLRGEPLEVMIITAISLAVAAVPESLPIVTTLALAIGARRMARHNAVVRHLAAVETLGSVTVLATDKTGTLTEGRMAAQRVWTPDGSVLDVGKAPIVGDTGSRSTRVDTGGLWRLLEAALLCSDAGQHGAEDSGGARHAGADPTEQALQALALRYGLNSDSVAKGRRRVAEIPFDSERRRMTTVHRNGCEFQVVVKGASETVLARVLDEPSDVITRAQNVIDEFERDGFRVLAFAMRSINRLPDDLADAEKNLTLIGLIAIADPPREDAHAWIDACRAAGIRVVLLTGDSAGTTAAIASRVGLIEPGAPVITGDVLDDLTNVDLRTLTAVARVSPEQKLEIVRALQHDGEVVAMIGDGVNDGPALRRADIGVAMGARGTEVAKQAADLVLLDDALGTLAIAVEGGRRVYANVRRFLRYGLSGGLAELLVMLAGPPLGLPLPLLPAQILWVNLLTHGLPGVAIGLEPGEPGAMFRRPRSPTEGVLGGHLRREVLLLGTWLAVVCLAVGVWARADGRPWQTMLFVLLGLLQLGVAVGLRSQPGRYDRESNPALLVAVAVAIGLQIAAAYAPPLQLLLSTDPLQVGDLAVVLAASSLGFTSVVAWRSWTSGRTLRSHD